MSDRQWRPPRYTTATAASVVGGLGWLAATATGVSNIVLVAAVGGAVLAVVARLASADRFRPVALAVAVGLTPIAGVFAAAGSAFVVLAQVAGLTPVGTVFVVVGLAVAAFGVLALVTRLDRNELVEAVAPSILAAMLAIVTASVPIAAALVANEPVELPSVSVAPVVRPVLAPSATPPPVGSFLLLVGLAAVAAGGLLELLPIRELLDDGTGTTPGVRALDWTRSVLAWWPLVMMCGVAAWLLIVAAPDLWTAGPDIVGTVAAIRALRAGYRRETTGAAAAASVPVGWGTVAAGAWTASDRVVEPLRATVVTVAPPSIQETFTREADAVVAYYGEPTVAVTVLAVGTVLGTAFLVGAALAAAVAFPRNATLGPGAAGGGLFLSGAFGLAATATTPRSLAALVGGIVVWDIARHGTVLGREIGRASGSRGVVFVHTASAVAVGGLAVGVSRWLAGTLTVLPVAGGEPIVALVASSLALVASALAFRWL